MAITIVGLPFQDLKNTAYEARDLHAVNTDTRINLSEAVIPNIQAMRTSGRVFAGTFPDFRQIENDICSWY